MKQEVTTKINRRPNTVIEKWVPIAIQKMRDGYSDGWISEYINKEGKVSPSTIDKILAKANLTIVDGELTKTGEINALHISRYNRLIARLLAVEEIPVDKVDGLLITWKMFWKSRNRKIRAYNSCLNVMRAKENLLQLHNEGFSIVVNNTEEVIVKETKPKINLDLLTFDEQLELLNLILKCKKTETELLGVKYPRTGPEIKFDTIEPLQEVQPNVELIMVEELPEPPNRVQVKRDPTVRLMENLNKMAALKFKEAGATLSPDEEALLE